MLSELVQSQESSEKMVTVVVVSHDVHISAGPGLEDLLIKPFALEAPFLDKICTHIVYVPWQDFFPNSSGAEWGS